MSRIPVPPTPFPKISTRQLPVGTILHRTHDSTLRPGAFNPCLGQPTRFAPFSSVATAMCVPTLYAATTREAAAFETIFHDIAAVARHKSIPLSVVENRTVSVLQTTRPFELACLFTPDLKAWRLRRNELIDTSKSTYGGTAAWARAIHHAGPTLDGMIWTSRQRDPEQSIVLFGDRAAEIDLSVVESRAVAMDATLLLELRGYGQRAGITIVS